MRVGPSIVFVSVLACAVASRPHTSRTAAQAGAGCKPADTNSHNVLRYLQDLLTSPSQSTAALRSTLGLRPGEANEVVMVSDNLECSRVANALNGIAAQHGNVGTWGKLYLFRVGATHLAAWNHSPGSHYSPVLFLDAGSYALIRAVLAF